MKRGVLLSIILISLFQNTWGQFNPQDSIKHSIQFYDSLVVLIINDSILLENSIEGEVFSKKHYEGVVYVTPDKKNIAKIELLFSDSPGERIILFLYEKSIIMVSVNRVEHYIINNTCYFKKNQQKNFCNIISAELDNYKTIVQTLFFLYSDTQSQIGNKNR